MYGGDWVIRPGDRVVVVNGSYAGKSGTVIEVDMSSHPETTAIMDGNYDKHGVDYFYISYRNLRVTNEV